MDNARPKLWASVLAIAMLPALAVWLWRRAAEPTSVFPPRLPAIANSSSSSAIAPLHAGLDDSLLSASTELWSAHGTGLSRQKLADLHKALSSTPTNEASASIRRFLDSKADAPTGQAFKVGGDGWLEESPTLRVFLLDYLGRLDPAAAAAYARSILSSMDSPNEWAVALRSLARGNDNTEGRALLERKTEDLLRHQAWQQNPSVGYLEAFDIAVYLRGTNLIPALVELVRKQDNPAVAHAAYLALDRLVIADAAGLLGALSADPSLMQGREETRANYFARADVRDPQQRQVLESYLLDARIGAAELYQFAGIFPNANYMISPNLLTPAPAPDHSELVSRDAESLRIVEKWLGDTRFAKLRPQLEKMKQRLEEFARQASGK